MPRRKRVAVVSPISEDIASSGQEIFFNPSANEPTVRPANSTAAMTLESDLDKEHSLRAMLNLKQRRNANGEDKIGHDERNYLSDEFAASSYGGSSSTSLTASSAPWLPALQQNFEPSSVGTLGASIGSAQPQLQPFTTTLHDNGLLSNNGLFGDAGDDGDEEGHVEWDMPGSACGGGQGDGAGEGFGSSLPWSTSLEFLDHDNDDTQPPQPLPLQPPLFLNTKDVKDQGDSSKGLGNGPRESAVLGGKGQGGCSESSGFFAPDSNQSFVSHPAPSHPSLSHFSAPLPPAPPPPPLDLADPSSPSIDRAPRPPATTTPPLPGAELWGTFGMASSGGSEGEGGKLGGTGSAQKWRSKLMNLIGAQEDPEKDPEEEEEEESTAGGREEGGCEANEEADTQRQQALSPPLPPQPKRSRAERRRRKKESGYGGGEEEEAADGGHDKEGGAAVRPDSVVPGRKSPTELPATGGGGGLPAEGVGATSTVVGSGSSLGHNNHLPSSSRIRADKVAPADALTMREVEAAYTLAPVDGEGVPLCLKHLSHAGCPHSKVCQPLKGRRRGGSRQAGPSTGRVQSHEPVSASDKAKELAPEVELFLVKYGGPRVRGGCDVAALREEDVPRELRRLRAAVAARARAGEERKGVEGVLADSAQRAVAEQALLANGDGKAVGATATTNTNSSRLERKESAHHLTHEKSGTATSPLPSGSGRGSGVGGGGEGVAVSLPSAALTTLRPLVSTPSVFSAPVPVDPQDEEEGDDDSGGEGDDDEADKDKETNLSSSVGEHGSGFTVGKFGGVAEGATSHKDDGSDNADDSDKDAVDSSRSSASASSSAFQRFLQGGCSSELVREQRTLTTTTTTTTATAAMTAMTAGASSREGGESVDKGPKKTKRKPRSSRKKAKAAAAAAAEVKAEPSCPPKQIAAEGNAKDNEADDYKRLEQEGEEGASPPPCGTTAVDSERNPLSAPLSSGVMSPTLQTVTFAAQKKVVTFSACDKSGEGRRTEEEFYDEDDDGYAPPTAAGVQTSVGSDGAKAQHPTTMTEQADGGALLLGSGETKAKKKNRRGGKNKGGKNKKNTILSNAAVLAQTPQPPAVDAVSTAVPACSSLSGGGAAEGSGAVPASEFGGGGDGVGDVGGGREEEEEEEEEESVRLIGVRVVLTGLRARPDMNGLVGVVVGFKQESERYSVLIDPPTVDQEGEEDQEDEDQGDEEEKAKTTAKAFDLKRVNLRVLHPNKRSLGPNLVSWPRSTLTQNQNQNQGNTRLGDDREAREEEEEETRNAFLRGEEPTRGSADGRESTGDAGAGAGWSREGRCNEERSAVVKPQPQRSWPTESGPTWPESSLYSALPSLLSSSSSLSPHSLASARFHLLEAMHALAVPKETQVATLDAGLRLLLHASSPETSAALTAAGEAAAAASSQQQQQSYGSGAGHGSGREESEGKQAKGNEHRRSSAGAAAGGSTPALYREDTNGSSHHHNKAMLTKEEECENGEREWLSFTDSQFDDNGDGGGGKEGSGRLLFSREEVAASLTLLQQKRRREVVLMMAAAGLAPGDITPAEFAEAAATTDMAAEVDRPPLPRESKSKNAAPPFFSSAPSFPSSATSTYPNKCSQVNGVDEDAFWSPPPLAMMFESETAPSFSSHGDLEERSSLQRAVYGRHHQLNPFREGGLYDDDDGDSDSDKDGDATAATALAKALRMSRQDCECALKMHGGSVLKAKEFLESHPAFSEEDQRCAAAENQEDGGRYRFEMMVQAQRFRKQQQRQQWKKERNGSNNNHGWEEEEEEGEGGCVDFEDYDEKAAVVARAGAGGGYNGLLEERARLLWRRRHTELLQTHQRQRRLQQQQHDRKQQGVLQGVRQEEEEKEEGEGRSFDPDRYNDGDDDDSGGGCSDESEEFSQRRWSSDDEKVYFDGYDDQDEEDEGEEDLGGVLLLSDPRDVSMCRVMQRALVTGATLPSGVKVPRAGKWVVEGRAVIDLKYGQHPYRARSEGGGESGSNSGGSGGKRLPTNTPSPLSTKPPLALPEVEPDSEHDSEDEGGELRTGASLVNLRGSWLSREPAPLVCAQDSDEWLDTVLESTLSELGVSSSMPSPSSASPTITTATSTTATQGRQDSGTSLPNDSVSSGGSEQVPSPSVATTAATATPLGEETTKSTTPRTVVLVEEEEEEEEEGDDEGSVESPPPLDLEACLGPRKMTTTPPLPSFSPLQPHPTRLHPTLEPPSPSSRRASRVVLHDDGGGYDTCVGDDGGMGGDKDEADEARHMTVTGTNRLDIGIEDDDEDDGDGEIDDKIEDPSEKVEKKGGKSTGSSSYVNVTDESSDGKRTGRVAGAFTPLASLSPLPPTPPATPVSPVMVVGPVRSMSQFTGSYSDRFLFPPPPPPPHHATRQQFDQLDALPAKAVPAASWTNPVLMTREAAHSSIAYARAKGLSLRWEPVPSHKRDRSQERYAFYSKAETFARFDEMQQETYVTRHPLQGKDSLEPKAKSWDLYCAVQRGYCTFTEPDSNVAAPGPNSLSAAAASSSSAAALKGLGSSTAAMSDMSLYPYHRHCQEQQQQLEQQQQQLEEEDDRLLNQPPPPSSSSSYLALGHHRLLFGGQQPPPPPPPLNSKYNSKLSREDQAVATLRNVGIGPLAAERLVVELGVRELGDFRYLRPDELEAVLETDLLAYMYYEDDDEEDDEEGPRGYADEDDDCDWFDKEDALEEAFLKENGFDADLLNSPRVAVTDEEDEYERRLDRRLRRFMLLEQEQEAAQRVVQSSNGGGGGGWGVSEAKEAKRRGHREAAGAEARKEALCALSTRPSYVEDVDDDDDNGGGGGGVYGSSSRRISGGGGGTEGGSVTHGRSSHDRHHPQQQQQPPLTPHQQKPGELSTVAEVVASQVECVRKALLLRGVVLGEAGPTVPNPDIVAANLTSAGSPCAAAPSPSTAFAALSRHRVVGLDDEYASPLSSPPSLPASPLSTPPALSSLPSSPSSLSSSEAISCRAAVRCAEFEELSKLKAQQTSREKARGGDNDDGGTRRLGQTKQPNSNARRLRTQAECGSIPTKLRARLVRMEALKEAGNVCLKQGLLEESREEYSKAIDLGTDFLLASMPNNHPGPESEEDDEDTDEGSSTQGSVVRGDRGSKQRGETKEGRGAGTEVEAEEEEAVLHRLMAILLSNRALTCLKLGDPKTALWDSIQAERLSPSYCKAPLRRGAAREAQQEWALAAEAYDRAATIASSSAFPYSSCSPQSPSAAEQAPSSPPLSASDLSIMKAALAARNRCQAKLKEQRSGEQQQQQGQQRQRAI